MEESSKHFFFLVGRIMTDGNDNLVSGCGEGDVTKGGKINMEFATSKALELSGAHRWVAGRVLIQLDKCPLTVKRASSHFDCS